jgi:hypothetical protein
MAECYSLMEKPTDALQWLSHCRYTPTVVMRRALANQQLRNYDVAIKLYTIVLDSANDDSNERGSTLYNRGLCYFRKWRDDIKHRQWLVGAQTDFSNALTLFQQTKATSQVNDTLARLSEGTSILLTYSLEAGLYHIECCHVWF